MFKSKKFYLYYFLTTILIQIGWIIYIIYRGSYERFIHIIIDGNSYLILKIFLPSICSVPLLITIFFYLTIGNFIPGSTYISWYLNELFDGKEKSHEKFIRENKSKSKHNL